MFQRPTIPYQVYQMLLIFDDANILNETENGMKPSSAKEDFKQHFEKKKKWRKTYFISYWEKCTMRPEGDYRGMFE